VIGADWATEHLKLWQQKFSIAIGDISGSQGNDYEDGCLLGCCTG
jgi:hypothetical protein